MTRELEAADIIGAHDHFARCAKAIIESGQDCAPQLFIVEPGERPGEIAGMLAFDPRLMARLTSSGGGKDALGQIIRRLFTTEPRARLLVHVSEAWTRSLAALSPAEVERLLDEHHDGYIEAHPERQEALMVSVHTEHRTYLGAHPITRGARGAQVALQLLSLDMQATGRLTVSDELPSLH